MSESKEQSKDQIDSRIKAIEQQVKDLYAEKAQLQHLWLNCDRTPNYRRCTKCGVMRATSFTTCDDCRICADCNVNLAHPKSPYCSACRNPEYGFKNDY